MSTSIHIVSERDLDQSAIEFNNVCIRLSEIGIETAIKAKQHLIKTGKATEDQLRDLDKLLEECEDFRSRLISEERNLRNE